MAFTKRDYEDYIASEAWAAKRERAFKKHGRACQACGNTGPGLHVHHHTYDRFRRERMDDLVILCPVCHRTVHKLHNAQRSAKGPNLSLTEVTFAFLAKADAGRVYSAAVMADHTPPVPPKPQRTDGKRTVSLARGDRKRSTDPKGVTKKAVQARARKTRELRKRLGL